MYSKYWIKSLLKNPSTIHCHSFPIMHNFESLWLLKIQSLKRLIILNTFERFLLWIMNLLREVSLKYTLLQSTQICSLFTKIWRPSRIYQLRGAWVTPSIKQPTLGFGSGRDLRTMGSGPMLVSRLSAVCMGFFLSYFPFAPSPVHECSLSLK